jgi:hypothetical protein
LCVGLAVVARLVPRPPPNWPTIVKDVGILLLLPLKLRLFVRLICKVAPVGTVMTTGDHGLALGFSLAQLAVEPLTTAPQL